jgi:hypothetical protein
MKALMNRLSKLERNREVQNNGHSLLLEITWGDEEGLKTILTCAYCGENWNKLKKNKFLPTCNQSKKSGYTKGDGFEYQITWPCDEY